jgi:hypothetical protein
LAEITGLCTRLTAKSVALGTQPSGVFTHMADFKTHITASTIFGLGYGGVAFGVFGMPLHDCVLAAAFCGLAGMLPDIDSGPGRPRREITAFISVLIPAVILIRLYQIGMAQSWRILIALAVYGVIRFGLPALLKRCTVHRGMFHSLVGAAIAGETAFLLLFGEETIVRWFIAGGVVLGFLSHLVLDEVYSVQWDGRPRLKKSFGTALKIYSHSWWGNVSTYAKLAVLTLVVIVEPGLFGDIRDGKAGEVARGIAEEIRQGLPKTARLPGSSESPDLQPPARMADSRFAAPMSPGHNVAPAPPFANTNRPDLSPTRTFESPQQYAAPQTYPTPQPYHPPQQYPAPQPYPNGAASQPIFGPAPQPPAAQPPAPNHWQQPTRQAFPNFGLRR